MSTTGLVGGALLSLAVGGAILGHDLEPVPLGASEPAPAEASAVVDSLERMVRLRERALAERAPRGTYIVIDRSNNRLWLRRRADVRLEATVSTGSGTVLQEAGGAERTWTFDTPTGRFSVLSKRANPVWTKPDWAFLEEGRQPPATLAERREKGSLGRWALDLGDGYMIHGTLYERLLGRSLTHGCIRVGRDDLDALARAAGPGTPVYIF